MHWNGSQSRLHGLLLSMAVAALAVPTAGAQAPGDNLPRPRLTATTPNGGKVGTTFDLTFAGSDLEEPQGLFFSHPGIKGEAIRPPAPPAPKPDPKADPKKPVPPPPPPPPVTTFKVTIAPDAPLGIHDVRLIGKYGISSARAFVVGDLTEVAEKEPNNDVPEAQKVELNSTVAGAIAAPTDVDYFTFSGKKGQRVVISCLTSSIDSRLRAALEVYDAGNRPLASNVRYRGDNALADVALPQDGVYTVRLFEFSHTGGSAEHFYRLSFTTAPWIDAVFPPMVEPGKTASVTIYGRNLPGGAPDPTATVGGQPLEKLVASVTAPDDPNGLRALAYRGNVPPPAALLDGFEYRIRNANGVSNPFLMTYATAPVVLGQDGITTAERAQEVAVPCEIAGRIEKLRDRDWYAFKAKKDQVFNVELQSERLGAPTDLYLVLRNVATKADIVELDDDPASVGGLKFATGTSDPPRHRFVVPADGSYQIMVASRHAETQAGIDHFYRLRIVPERPDFRLILLPFDADRPDSCVLWQGGQQAFEVAIQRLDNWNGAVTLTAEGLPQGVTCTPQVLGAGMTRSLLVLNAAADAPVATTEIRIKGIATIDGSVVSREARPAGPTWGVAGGQNITMVGRLDRNFVVAVREKAPFSLTASLDRAAVFPGEKANLTLRLARVWPEFKQPLNVTINAAELPANLTLNNNQPVTIAADKNDAQLVVYIKPNVAPGVYNLFVRGTAQIPYNKDPKAKEKPATNVVLPSSAVALTVLPAQYATVTAAPAAPTVKVGGKADVVVKVARQNDYTGPFLVRIVLPTTAKGVSVGEASIPAGKDEVKLVVAVAGDAAPVNLTDIKVQATALLRPDLPVGHEAKFNLNVVK